jgi:signal transduction histidine kinase/CheY-like chemotaxis protein
MSEPDAAFTTGPGGTDGPTRTREQKLQRLIEAGMLLNQELSLETLLERLVEVASTLLEARYVALGVLAPDGHTLENFITTGMTEAQKLAIGPLPTGKGLLGAMLSEGRPLRVADLGKDPRSIGFPPNHPPMASFLGVPIIWRGQVFGRLYCTEKLTAREFSEEDKEFASLLAAQAAIAIENAKLYENARAASRLKSEFLANMSHELRTPMNAILGFTELVGNGTLGPVSAKQTGALERVLRNARNLLALINDVLDLSKIEAGKMTLVEADLAPRAMVEEVVASLVPLAAAKGLSLQVDHDGAPSLLRGDEGKIRQILLNLLSNAVKFTEQGGVTVRVRASDEAWTVVVADTGEGIASENQEIIFEEFRQVDASSTRQAGGTGLGLAIARRMARLMGGNLQVQSQPGEGSTFTLTLPRIGHSAVSPGLGTGPSTIRPGSRLVLAIDDNPDILDLMVSRLASTEFSVVTALGGEAGLSVAHQVHPDLITLDILMPVLDGWEVLRRLKASPVTRHIPVVMVSILENRALAFGLEAAECLVKPVSRDQLLEVLRRHVPGHHGAPVLIVDDEGDARALVREVLASAGMPTVEAASGEEALAAIALCRPSLVVLDLTMPGLDGFAVLEYLSGDDDLRTLPVVVLTAMTLSPDDEARLVQAAMLVLNKSTITPDRLLDQLRSVIEHRLPCPAGRAHQGEPSA